MDSSAIVSLRCHAISSYKPERVPEQGVLHALRSLRLQQARLGDRRQPELQQDVAHFAAHAAGRCQELGLHLCTRQSVNDVLGVFNLPATAEKNSLRLMWCEHTHDPRCGLVRTLRAQNAYYLAHALLNMKVSRCNRPTAAVWVAPAGRAVDTSRSIR